MKTSTKKKCDDLIQKSCQDNVQAVIKNAITELEESKQRPDEEWKNKELAGIGTSQDCSKNLKQEFKEKIRRENVNKDEMSGQCSSCDQECQEWNNQELTVLGPGLGLLQLQEPDH